MMLKLIYFALMGFILRTFMNGQVLTIQKHDIGKDTANSTCSMAMFGGDFSAYMACKTEFAHQSNWFPSPIAGLFSYLVSAI